jgi:hypothetical protein
VLAFKTSTTRPKKSCLLFAALFISYSLVQAQTLRRPVAAPYTSLGAYSTGQSDVFSFTANQASLAQLKNISAGVYAERRFMLAELNNYTAVVSVPTFTGNFGLKTSYSGFGGYNETQLGFAYGRKLGKKIDVGVQFNYNGVRITEYGNASAISFELGTVLHLTEQLNAGFHVSNPVGGKFGKDQQEKLASVYTVGLGYDASDKFFISAAIEKEEDQPVNVNAGLQYKFLPQLMAKLGMSSATSSVWMGVGLYIKTFRIDITASYHPQLGVTPGLLILFNFKGKEK